MEGEKKRTALLICCLLGKWDAVGLCKHCEFQAGAQVHLLDVLKWSLDNLRSRVRAKWIFPPSLHYNPSSSWPLLISCWVLFRKWTSSCQTSFGLPHFQRRNWWELVLCEATKGTLPLQVSADALQLGFSHKAKAWLQCMKKPDFFMHKRLQTEG